MTNFDHRKLEKKWQDFWEKNKTFRAKDFSKKPKYYAMDMFPYPSGAGLHVGHPLGYTATDIICRKKRQQGYEVLHPMGWDAFGLPAENYAIKTGVHPAISTQENINNFRRQIQSLGFSYDWDREIDSTDPEYYKWSQWIFLQLYKKGLAYEKEMGMNWCPKCKVVCANEEVEAGRHERCGEMVEKKKLKQWMFRITDYAERLLNDLEDLPQWPEKIKSMQRHWIGKSEGAEVDFEIEGEKVTVFTTRPDTLFGATYFVLSPEHPLVNKITTDEQQKAIEAYQKECAAKSDLERTELNKEKTGVFTGAYAINPVNGKRIPVWIADYVMMTYGTGAIMAVPAHDERDLDFAKKFDLEVIEVVGGLKDPFQKSGGVLKNSEFLDGLKIEAAIQKMIEWLEEKNLGKRKVNYKLRDWIFTRQRYWGEPIPLIHCEDCGVVPHDPEWAKYFDTKEKRGGSKGYSKGNSALALYSPRIVASESPSVKFYRKKGVFLRSIKTKCKTAFGTVFIKGEELEKHFYRQKTMAELRERKRFIQTVLLALPQIDTWYDHGEEKIGFFRTKNRIMKVVVGSNAVDGYFLKTYYTVRIATKNWLESLKEYSLPLILPETPNYEPSETGESPLAKITDWVNCECPKCGKTAKRETSTMPNWAGSSWYWLRYMDPKNKKSFCDKKLEAYWGPVDLYVGGAEHAVLHLLYSRFWHKVFYDLGLVHTKEPFTKLVNQGLILSFAYENEAKTLIPVDEVEEKNGKFFHTDTGEEVFRIVAKMSKSLKNVVNPDDIIQEFGADTLRMYEMFMGPFEQSKAWDTGAVAGIRKFLDRVYRLFDKPFDEIRADGTCETGMKDEVRTLIHKTVKQVTDDIDAFKFNTAISAMMVFVNEAQKWEKMPKKTMEKFILLLSPFAPHLAEEIWSEKLGHRDTLAFAEWPTYKEEFLVESSVTYAVQINGKVRGDFQISKDATKEEVLEKARSLENAQRYFEGGEIKKEIFVPGKIAGFVVK